MKCLCGQIEEKCTCVEFKTALQLYNELKNDEEVGFLEENQQN